MCVCVCDTCVCVSRVCGSRGVCGMCGVCVSRGVCGVCVAGCIEMVGRMCSLKLMFLKGVHVYRCEN